MNLDFNKREVPDSITAVMFRETHLDQCVSDEGNLLVGGDFHLLRFKIDRFVREVEKSNGTGFFVTIDRHGNRKFHERALARKYYALIPAFMASWIKGFYFAPHVSLFYQIVVQMKLGQTFMPNPHMQGLDTPELCGDLFNRMIFLIRWGTRKEKFTRSINVKAETLKQIYKEYGSYFDALMDRYSKLLVLRIDFAYTKEYASTASVDELRADFKRFLNLARGKSPTFATKTGYIWKMEHAQEKGFHIHMIFFLNGRDVKDHVGWARKYGEAWKSCTRSGKGFYFSCNAKWRSYKRLGIGMISRHYGELRLNFKREVLSYLTKSDQCLLLKPLKNMRTIGKGEIRQEREGARLGRPRTNMPRILRTGNVVIDSQ